MTNKYPTTLIDAYKIRYGAGKYAYVTGRCAHKVYSEGGAVSRQCSRQRCSGPERLYCTQHGDMVWSTIDLQRRAL